MTTLDGVAVCVICRETFEFGHHYEFHVSMCRDRRRNYVKMDPKIKQQAVELVEGFMRSNLPGILVGYGEPNE